MQKILFFSFFCSFFYHAKTKEILKLPGFQIVYKFTWQIYVKPPPFIVLIEVSFAQAVVCNRRKQH